MINAWKKLTCEKCIYNRDKFCMINPPVVVATPQGMSTGYPSIYFINTDPVHGGIKSQGYMWACSKYRRI